MRLQHHDEIVAPVAPAFIRACDPRLGVVDTLIEESLDRGSG